MDETITISVKSTTHRALTSLASKRGVSPGQVVDEWYESRYQGKIPEKDASYWLELYDETRARLAEKPLTLTADRGPLGQRGSCAWTTSDDPEAARLYRALHDLEVRIWISGIAPVS